VSSNFNKIFIFIVRNIKFGQEIVKVLFIVTSNLCSRRSSLSDFRGQTVNITFSDHSTVQLWPNFRTWFQKRLSEFFQVGIIWKL